MTTYAEWVAPVWHPPVRPPRRGATAGEVLVATAVLLVLLAVFLWKPLTSGGAYTSADLIQSSPLVRTVARRLPLRQHPAHRPRAPDAPVAGVEQGAAPRRRPARCGTPTTAPAPPTWPTSCPPCCRPSALPFYVLPWPAALLASAALKLLVLGLFTYLFLRKVAALAPGRAGGGGRVHVRRLQRPVAGLAPSRAPPSACPPACTSPRWPCRPATRVRQRLAWCGYALAVLGAFLAGHPETLFFSWGLVLVYVPLRLLALPGAG